MEGVSERRECISCSKASGLIKNVCDCDWNCDVISEAVQFGTKKRNKNFKTDTTKLSLKFLDDTLIGKRNNADSIFELIFNAVMKEELGVPDKVQDRFGAPPPPFQVPTEMIMRALSVW
jgi:hypothetical protein